MADIKYNSKEYLDDSALEVDKKAEKYIRSKVNDWANEIPHHPFDDLGDTINIKGAETLFMYRSELHTQFDSRSVCKATVPFANQNVPDFENDRPEKVDIWSRQLETTDRFVNSSAGTYTVDHSQTVAACYTCKGAGGVVCPSCRGTKSHMCSACSGSGKVPHYTYCGSCSGRGYTVTYTSETTYRIEDGKRIPCGTKSVPHRHTCSGCGGKGKVQRGYDSCSSCRGTGKIICSTCKGSGTVICETCKGHKKLLHYLYIRQQLEYKYRKLYNVELPDEEFKPIVGLVDEKYYKSVDSFSNDSGVVEGDFSAIPFVGASAQKMLQERHAEAGHADHILFERLDVKRTSVTKVDYAFDGILYTLYITEGGKVQASHSPISVYTDELKQKAVRQARRRFLRSADANFEKLYDITDNDAFWDMSASVAEKMHNDMRLGSNLALVISAVVLFPLVSYYLSDISWVAPWIDLADATTSWTWKFLPYLYTAAALFGGYKISRLNWWYIYEKIPTFLLRLLTGMAIAVVGVAGCTAAIGAAHFLVLPAIFETAGQIILLPWNLVMLVLGILF